MNRQLQYGHLDLFLNSLNSALDADIFIGDVHSTSLRNAQILTSVIGGVETLCKSIYKIQDGTKKPHEVYFDQDVIDKVRLRWVLREKPIEFKPGYEIVANNMGSALFPFMRNATRETSCKKNYYWNEAYQNLKHDLLPSLDKWANKKTVISALFVNYVLLKCLDELKGEQSFTSQIEDRIPFNITVKENTDTRTVFADELVIPRLDGIDNYMHRSIAPFQLGVRRIYSEQKSLYNLVSSERKIVLLGVGGLGKSIELRETAALISKDLSGRLPILVDLSSYNRKYAEKSLEKLIIEQAPYWKKDRGWSNVLFFDGLDEVESSSYGPLCKQISDLSRKYAKSVFVVAARNSLYIDDESDLNRLEDFKQLALLPLTIWEIREYAKSHLSESLYSSFLVEVEVKRLRDLLGTPFFLRWIVKYFAKKKCLPGNYSEILKLAVEQLISTDKVKAQYSDLDLSDYRKAIFELVTRAAFSVHISRDFEISPGILDTSDPNLNRALKRTSILSRNPRGKWVFEHRLLSEYLCAVLMADLNIDQLKTLSADRTNGAGIPFEWRNIVICLVGIHKQRNELLDWVKQQDDAFLISCSKDQVFKVHRELIFRSTLAEFNSKDIGIRHPLFDHEQLAYFVSDSKGSFDFLLEELQSLKKDNQRLNILFMLRYFDEELVNRDELNSILLTVLSDKRGSNALKSVVLETLADFGFVDSQVVDQASKTIVFSASPRIRGAFYRLLLLAELGDFYHLMLVEGVQYAEGLKKSTNLDESEKGVNYPSEWESLKKLISNLNKVSSIEAFLELSFNLPQASQYKTNEFVNCAIQRLAIIHFEDRTRSLNIVMRFVLQHDRLIDQYFGNSLRLYFEENELNLRAFETIVNQINNSDRNNEFASIEALLVVFNEQCLESLKCNLRDGRLRKLQVLRILYGLSRNTQEQQKFFERVFFELQPLLPNKLIELPQNDAQKRNAKIQNERLLLQNRNELIAQVTNLFEQFGENGVLKSDSYCTVEFQDKLRDSMVLKAVFNPFFRGPRDRAFFSKIRTDLTDPVKWKRFVAFRLINFETQLDHYSIDSWEKDHLIDWVISESPAAAFSCTLREGSERFSYFTTDLRLAYVIARFSIVDLNKTIYRKLVEMLTDNLPQPKTAEKRQWQLLESTIKIALGAEGYKRVLLNRLSSSDLSAELASRYIDVAVASSWEEARDFIVEVFKHQKYERWLRSKWIDNYLNLNGKIIDLEGFLDYEKNEMVRSKLVTKLIEADSLIAQNSVYNYLKNDGTDERYYWITQLAKFDFDKAVALFVSYTTKNKLIHESSFDFSEATEKHVDLIIQLVHDVFVHEYDKDKFRPGRRDFLKTLVLIGSKSEEGYNRVKRHFETLLADFPEQKFVHSMLSELDVEYQKVNYSALSLEEAFDLSYELVPK